MFVINTIDKTQFLKGADALLPSKQRLQMLFSK
jgi:hypothetical protein